MRPAYPNMTQRCIVWMELSENCDIGTITVHYSLRIMWLVILFIFLSFVFFFWYFYIRDFIFLLYCKTCSTNPLIKTINIQYIRRFTFMQHSFSALFSCRFVKDSSHTIHTHTSQRTFLVTVLKSSTAVKMLRIFTD